MVSYGNTDCSDWSPHQLRLLAVVRSVAKPFGSMREFVSAASVAPDRSQHVTTSRSWRSMSLLSAFPIQSFQNNISACVPFRDAACPRAIECPSFLQVQNAEEREASDIRRPYRLVECVRSIVGGLQASSALQPTSWVGAVGMSDTCPARSLSRPPSSSIMDLSQLWFMDFIE